MPEIGNVVRGMTRLEIALLVASAAVSTWVLAVAVSAAALAWLDRAPGPGGVLTRAYLGTAVPALTGRSTWVGNQFWTPEFFPRAAEAAELFAGMSAGQAQRFVRRTGARFVLADCRSSPDVAARLGAMIRGDVRFGCAHVLEVR
jgi:hypothetical protein